MAPTLEQLKEQNKTLKAQHRIIKSRIVLHKFLQWITTDLKIKKIRKELYDSR